MARERAAALFRVIFGSGIRLLPGVVVAVVKAAIIVAARQHLAPHGWRWLDEEELNALRAFLFGGAAVGAVSVIRDSSG